MFSAGDRFHSRDVTRSAEPAGIQPVGDTLGRRSTTCTARALESAWLRPLRPNDDLFALELRTVDRSLSAICRTPECVRAFDSGSSASRPTRTSPGVGRFRAARPCERLGLIRETWIARGPQRRPTKHCSRRALSVAALPLAPAAERRTLGGRFCGRTPISDRNGRQPCAWC